MLRLVLEIDGEIVVRLYPEIGYLHTGIEKTCEAKFYQQVVPLTDRVDYLGPMNNNLAYSLAVEKLMDLEIPEREGAVAAGAAERANAAQFPPHLAGHARHGYGCDDGVPLHISRARRPAAHLSRWSAGSE